MANQFTKDSIKARMYRQATTLWGVRNIENIDSSLKLLIEALSAEIFRLSAETGTVENRLLEKVASALTPHTALIARPAHAIAMARPYSPEATLLPTDTFVYKSAEIVKKYKLKSMSFTPLHEAEIINAELKYLVAGGEFYNITPYGERDLVARLSRSVGNKRQVWLGVKFGNNVRTAGSLRFYVDIPYTSDKNSYLQLLSHCHCTIGGKTVETRVGTGSIRPCSILEKYNTDRIITEEIISRYDPHFLSLVTSGISVSDLSKTPVPEDIAGLLPGEFIAGCDAGTVWINISFPPLFSDEILSRITFHLNAFAVANKFPATVSRKVDAVSSVIPLLQGDQEYFLSVDSVSDNSGNVLGEISPDTDSQAGCYSVRRGGCERFNTMDARDFLARLVDVLYDESSAFSSTDKDGVKEDIWVIQEQVARLERKNKQNSEKPGMMSYIITDGLHDDNTVLTVNYKLTNGGLANSVYAGELLGSCTNPDIDPSTARFVTSAKGGMQAPSPERRLDMYRFLLLSHGSIYSKEDIRNFCMAKFGDYITAVSVTLGYTVSKAPRQGFIRTLDVHVTPSEKMKGIDREEFTGDLWCELKRFSPETYNYRILIEEK